MPHFRLHHQVHQGQPRLAQQMADSFLQKTHDVGHGKDHLDVGILFARQLAELLHRALLFDLVSLLHGDSLLFLAENEPSTHYGRGMRVATFYELTDILRYVVNRYIRAIRYVEPWRAKRWHALTWLLVASRCSRLERAGVGLRRVASGRQ